MKAFLHRLHLGGGRDRDRDPPPSPSSSPALPQWPPPPAKPLPPIDKKVAFVSPPPTPQAADRALPDPPPLKTTVSRFHAREPRASDARAASTPPPSTPSLRSDTPYSQLSSSGSRILAAASWSQLTEEDLVTNIGARERTRQEVLFEIISSEERYVHELAKMKDTFVDPLLHPFSTPAPPSVPSSSTPNLDFAFYRPDSPLESADHLPPIAARFMSPSPTAARPNDTIEYDSDDDRVPSPYRASVAARSRPPLPFPTPSHFSLPSTHSLVDNDRDRKFSHGEKIGMLKKFKKSAATAVLGGVLAPHQIPEDLRRCLEVVDSGVLDGHRRLSEALRKRYDDQYPLVRSLADVFVSNSDIFTGYKDYVIHLERALDQVDAALQNVSSKKPKNQDAAEWQKVCKLLQKLEGDACDKGETGLAITLSKPFQRLLKYPLLFQNLLFHTDPSTFEYESTLQMVAEIENIVRSIEDQKIQREERDKTRDVFARIEGLDKVKQLALPKPSRLLVEERPCPVPPLKGPSPPPVGVRGKPSFKRLSDVLQGNNGIGGKKDLWFVVFNDVVLQCQRTGTTSVPLVAALTSRASSMPELQGKTKYATTGRRNVQTKPRNLYKFIKIETWAIGDVVQPREGVVSMEDVVRSRAHAQTRPRIVPLPADDDEANDSDDSDRKSKMSFSYWGADKVTVQKPLVKGRTPSALRRGSIAASYGRESSANAKFGTRLVAGDTPTTRPTSRRTQTATPASSRRPMDDTPHSARATVTRPAWNAGNSSPAPSSSKRSRNTSQTSAATRMTIPAKTVGSPVPSEDSGVGFYRQYIAQDSTLNHA
ncbi:RhoGEF domain-containing protein gxcJ [Termitomyces sp. T112]|nr:RhoGEF domain-containing protein gxcJ [Termitomyces sp. T112]